MRATDLAYERAYEEHWSDVFRFALAWTNDWAEAEDLTQEAYLRLWTLQRACDVQLACAQAGGEVIRLSQPVIDRMLAESGPGESKTCEDVFAAMVRLVDARDPSYRD